MARTKRKTVQRLEPTTESTMLRTVDGRDVVVVGDTAKELFGRRVCAGGIGHGCYRQDPHPYAARRTYNDWSRNLRGVKLRDDQIDSVYYCRRCKKFQGCHLCVGDPASLVCTNCHDWANDISEHVHGKMVPRETALKVNRIVKVLGDEKAV